MCKKWVPVIACAAAIAPASASDEPDISLECFVASESRIQLLQNVGQPNENRWDVHLRKALWGHELEAGSARSRVIGVREYTDPKRGADSQSFLKVTAEVTISEGKTEEYIISVTRSFHTSGSTGHVGSGQYVRTEDPVHAITVRQGTLTLKANIAGDDGTIKPYEVTCPLKTIGIEELTPWQGKPGGRWLSFAPTRSVKK